MEFFASYDDDDDDDDHHHDDHDDDHDSLCVAGRGLDFPQELLQTSQNFPELPQKFSGNFPGTSLAADFKWETDFYTHPVL